MAIATKENKMKNQALVIVLNDKQKEQAKKALKAGKSLYTQIKGLFASDVILLDLFATRKAKEIITTIYGDQVLEDPEYALTENRQRTAFGNAVHNLKKVAKKLTAAEENAEKPKIKKCVNVCNDLDLIVQNWDLYNQNEQNSIAHHLEKLIKAISKK